MKCLLEAFLERIEVNSKPFVQPMVQWHLRHVFQKLGVSSRAELAAKAARRRP